MDKELKQELKFIKKLKPAENGETLNISPNYILLRLQKIQEEMKHKNTDKAIETEVRVLELMGKYFKMWQGEHSVNVNINEFLRDITTSDVGYDDILAENSKENKSQPH